MLNKEIKNRIKMEIHSLNVNIVEKLMDTMIDNVVSKEELKNVLKEWIDETLDNDDTLFYLTTKDEFVSYSDFLKMMKDRKEFREMKLKEDDERVDKWDD